MPAEGGEQIGTGSIATRISDRPGSYRIGNYL